ncbi:F-Box protein [Musa troglodytarum]|uniref:F-Box protein n=1 Tax=Musa troglodytarum TaxID=320322 RepID=A0A9E7GMZ7_9LILI|nr:F-Box protein [Musa troglodytarum]
MPSVLGETLDPRAAPFTPSLTSFHGGCSSHRLKQLRNKWNRRDSRLEIFLDPILTCFESPSASNSSCCCRRWRLRKHWTRYAL